MPGEVGAVRMKVGPSPELTVPAPPSSGRPTRKPTRAERRDAAKLHRQALQVQEQARADIPAGFRVNPEGTGRLIGRGDAQLTGVSSVGETRRRRKAQESLTGKVTRKGRPSDYTDEEADAICAWIQEG